MPKFTDIRFGYASAESESSNAPELLLNAYFDESGIIKEALFGHKFIFLGYKGSGKTAIAERSRLLAEQRPDLFVTLTYLEDFPFTAFKKVVGGDVDPESRYPTAWSWLLLARLIGSFNEDNGTPYRDDPTFRTAVTGIERLGLLPMRDVKEFVLASSKASFKVQIPKLLELAQERIFEGQDLQMVQLVDYLRRVACAFKSPNRHVLIIDGLDDVLTQRVVQYRALSALFWEASRLNAAFVKAGAPAKIVLLCRTDLFERLPGANKNKIRRDASITLDWYHDPREPAASGLMKLVNLRARVTAGSHVDVTSTYLPSTIHKETDDVKKLLLDHTRHTPRDFVQLFTSLQAFGQGGRMTRDQVLSGLRDYSINYFLPEIRDELDGYVPENEIDPLIELLAAMRARDFSWSDLRSRATEIKTGVSDLEEAVKALFECSAVGTIQHRPTGSAYFTFKYRNRVSSLNFSERLILHQGAWKALNVA